ncbi:MAG: insulinase family protein [Parachlamydiales bacterium]
MKKKTFFLFPCLIFSFVLFLKPLQAEYKTLEDHSRLKFLAPALKDLKIGKFELQNNLEVLIISDPETKISACALALKTGSWHDPEKYPGMAHFVEHMLFHGSGAYPESDGFAHFLSSHGGERNGYTSLLESAYFFSIPNSAAEEALDRFSRFFIDPLFDPSSTSKELFAVDEEYRLQQTNDSFRSFQVGKELASPSHPHRQFSIGSKETLANIPREELFLWYKKHYSANLMKVVFYTQLPLDKAIFLIDQKFKAIPNRQIGETILNEPFLSSKQKGHVAYIEPLKELKKFSITFEADRKFVQDDSALKLLCYLFNRGHNQSLLASLKKQKLIENCSFSHQPIGPYALLSADFDLTETGIKKIDQVASQFQGALQKLSTQLPSKALFKEMNRIAALNYAYLSRPRPEDITLNFASSLLKEPLATFPDKTYLAQKYSKKDLQELLGSLKLAKGYFEVLAKKNKTGIEPDREETWLKAKYALLDLPPSWQEKTLSLFELPPLNPFIPSDFSLIPPLQKEPFQTIDSSAMQSYFQQSPKILEPKINCQLHFYSAFLDGSLHSAALSDLLVLHFTSEITPTLREAAFGGLNFSLSSSSLKLNFGLSGFSHKAPLFLASLLKELKSFSPSFQDFSEYKKELLNYYANRQKDFSFEQGLDETYYLLNDKSYYPASMLLKEAEALTYEEYLLFLKTLFQKGFLESALAGNLNTESAKNIALEAQRILAFKPYPKKDASALILPSEPSALFKPVNQNGSALVLVLDQNPFSLKNRSLQMLVSPLLNEAFFHTLRSEEKLGYVAHAKDLELKKHLYMLLFLQSNSTSGEELLKRTENFLEIFVKKTQEAIPLARFENLKEDLLVQLKEPPKNLEELSWRLDKCAFHYKDLNYYIKLASSMEKLSYPEFLTFIQASLSSENLKKTAVIVQDKKPASLPTPYLMTTTELLKTRALESTATARIAP